MSLTLRLRRPLFCCCCCSISSMAEAGGEAARMALTTLMLSSGSGGRLRRSRPRTFISCSSSKPPRVNWRKAGGTIGCYGRRSENKTQTGSDLRTRIVFQSRRSTFFMGKCGAFMLQNLVTMVKRRRAKGSPLYRGEPSGEQDRKMNTNQ